MNNEQFFKAIDGVDDELLKDVIKGDPEKTLRGEVYRIERKPFSFKSLAGAAACLAAVVGAGFLLKAGIDKQISASESTATSPADYVSAANGEQSIYLNSEVQSFSYVFDCVELIVTTDKSEYNLGDTINVKATVKNTGDKTIGLFVGTGTPNSHMEIETQITLDDRHLIDPDKPQSFNDVTTPVLTTVLIEPGKEYVQEMQFETYYYSYDMEKNLAEPGLYIGTSQIKVLLDLENRDAAAVSRSVEFSVRLTDSSVPNHNYPDHAPYIIMGDYLDYFEYHSQTYFKAAEEEYYLYDFSKLGKKVSEMVFMDGSKPNAYVFEYAEDENVLIAEMDEGVYVPYRRGGRVNCYPE